MSAIQGEEDMCALLGSYYVRHMELLKKKIHEEPLMVPDEAHNWKRRWWKYNMVRNNFLIHVINKKQTSVVCYKCNQDIGDPFFSDLKMHLDTTDHYNSDIVWYRSGGFIGENLRFPSLWETYKKKKEMIQDRDRIKEELRRGVINLRNLGVKRRQKKMHVNDAIEKIAFRICNYRGLDENILTDQERVDIYKEAAGYRRHVLEVQRRATKNRASTKANTNDLTDKLESALGIAAEDFVLDTKEDREEQKENERAAKIATKAISRYDPVKAMQKALDKYGSQGTKTYMKYFKIISKFKDSLDEYHKWSDVFDMFKEKKRREGRTGASINNYAAPVNFYIKRVLKNSEPFVTKAKVDAPKPQEILLGEDLEPDVLDKLRARILKNNPKLLPAFEIALYTGIRAHEIAKVKKSDFKEIKGKGGKKGLELAVLGKGRKFESTISFDKPLLDIYKDIKKSSKEFLFVPDSYRKLSADELHIKAINKGNTISKAFARVTEAVYGKAISAHDLRRTFATLLYQQDVPNDTIQKQMRHTNISTTMRYINDAAKKEKTQREIEKVALMKDMQEATKKKKLKEKESLKRKRSGKSGKENVKNKRRKISESVEMKSLESGKISINKIPKL